MDGVIRTVRVEEFEEFVRFLEVCFGHSRGFFQREFPHLYQPDAEACGWGHVIEQGGKLVSHVGVYPLDIVVDGVAVAVGGIGGVCTAREARGRHGMSRLLRHAIGVMRDKGFLLSGLGGDRHRYGAFGWEYAGQTYSLRLNARSLDRAGAKPGPVTDVGPDTAVPVVARLGAFRSCQARRPRLGLQLQKQRLRFFTADDGYVIGYGENWGTFSIVEAVSASGQETALVRGVLSRTNCGDATWTVSAWEPALLGRLMPAVSWWNANFDWDYRLISVAGFLGACEPILERRAEGLKDFDVSFGIVEHDRTDVASVTLDRGKIAVEAGRRAKTHLDLDPGTAVRLILGGPPGGAGAVPAPLQRLFPVPMHVPALDHV